MAQLDLTTYMSQLSWFFIIFITVYILAFKIFLPKLAIVLKTRNKTIEFFNKELSTKELDIELSEKFIFDTLQTYKLFLTKVNNKSSHNLNLLKKALIVNYQNYFVSNKIYTNYIYSK